MNSCVNLQKDKSLGYARWMGEHKWRLTLATADPSAAGRAEQFVMVWFSTSIDGCMRHMMWNKATAVSTAESFGVQLLIDSEARSSEDSRPMTCISLARFHVLL